MKKGILFLFAVILLAGCDQLTSIVSPKADDTTPPGEVVNLVAVPGDGQVSLTWVDPADSDFAAVQVTAAGQTTPVAKGTQTVQLSGLVNGSDVLILVRTLDKSGNKSSGVSVTSRPVAAPVTDTTPPAEVTDLTAAPGDGEVVLSWTPPGDADFHHVVVTGAGQALTVAKGVATATLSGLINGTSYSFTVTSVDTSDNVSAGVSVAAQPAGAPIEPPTVYTVTFDTLGGSAVAPATGLPAGSAVPVPSVPVKTGYAFAGWFADAGLSVSWDFKNDTVTANKTLYARWGSDAAVGAWFDLQNANQADAYPDDMETIMVFQTSGQYKKYQRLHQASATSWGTVSSDDFLTVEAGSYSLLGGSLTTRPRQIDVVALGLLSGAVTDSTGIGLKTKAEALALVAGTAWEASLDGWFAPATRTATVGNGTYLNWRGTVPRLTAGSNVYHASPLAVAGSESGDDFRTPNGTSQYPADVQPFLPVVPDEPSGHLVKAVFDAYGASAFATGLAAAGSALTADATAKANTGATNISGSGTTGSVIWTNLETISVSGANYTYSGSSTYRPTGNEDLGNGLTLLSTSIGNVTYGGNQDGQSSNLGTWTLRFTGSPVTTIVYVWDDLTKSIVSLSANNGLTYTAQELQ